jgi:ribosomal protein S18 acetylase RimI-like enzyme
MLTHRTAGISDIPLLNQLVNRAYRGDEAKKGWTNEAHLIEGVRTTPESLKALIEKPNSGVELIYQETKLIGCFQFDVVPSESYYFGMLVVDPTLQNQGLGKQIFGIIESEAKRHGCKKVKLFVIHSRPELIAYYERRDFKLTGYEEPFPSHDPSNGKLLVDELRLLEMEKPLT